MSESRIALIESRLRNALNPSFLEIQDDSAAHRGHEGAKGGAGHFTVKIQSASFAGKTRVQQHQLVYRSLQDLIPKEIHAINIIIP